MIFFVWSYPLSNSIRESISLAARQSRSWSEMTTWLPESVEVSWISTKWSPRKPRSSACKSASRWRRNSRRSRRPWLRFWARRRHHKRWLTSSSEIQVDAKYRSNQSWMQSNRVKGVTGNAANLKSDNSQISSFKRNRTVWTNYRLVRHPNWPKVPPIRRTRSCRLWFGHLSHCKKTSK